MKKIIIHKEYFDLIKDISIKCIYEYISLDEAILNNKFGCTYEEIESFGIYSIDNIYWHIFTQNIKQSSPIYKIIEKNNKVNTLFTYIKRKETLKELDI